jgi:hypothetical protein
MIIQTTHIDELRFIEAFQTLRPNAFTLPGLEALFEMLEEYGEETPIELDVVAMCCDFSEYTLQSVIDYYDIDVADIEDDEIEEVVEDYISNNLGMWIKTSEDLYIIQS